MRAMTGRPRVIIASRLFAPEVGAAAFRLSALAEGLLQLGSRVRVLTSTLPASVAEVPHRPDLAISRFPVLRDDAGYVRGYLQYLSFDLPLFFRLLFARGDVVVAEPPPTTGAVVAVACWLRQRRFAYYAADVWTDAVAATTAPRMVIRLMRLVEGFALRRASVVLAVSDDVAERVRSFGARNIAVVGNGVDTNVFTADGPRAESPRPCFVYTGTMSEWQGADVFISAFRRVLAEHPDAQLHFFGQGTHEQSLRALAERTAPGSIHFHGVVSPAETATWLRSATAAVVSIVPGAGYDFAKPTKVYAAAACGTPVIFAGVGAGAQLVTDNQLGTQSVYDPEAVADAMRTAVADEQRGLRDRLRAARADWAREHASLHAMGRVAATAVAGLARPRQALDSQQ